LLSVIHANLNGRILIPKSVRELYKLDSAKKVELFYKDQGIYVWTTVRKRNTAVLRTINAQGRLSIPSAFRRQMNWERHNNIEIFFVKPDCFFLQGDKRACVLCSNTFTDMVLIHGKYICNDCLQTALGKRYLNEYDKGLH
jgi:bifunctional DNA-binding transcriptional regulator/antitoxin component of YhaV-PrlF toxin-antitoxin module